MTAADDENDGQATERVVIRDRRKIDPKAEAKDSRRGQGEVGGGAHRAADPEESTAAEPEEAVQAPPSAPSWRRCGTSSTSGPTTCSG